MLEHLRSPRGVTLLEIMVVVAIIGVLAAIAAPNLAPMVKQTRLFGAGEGTAAFLDATRRRAVGDSRCYRVRAGTGNALIAEKRTSGDCVTDLADADWALVQTFVPESPRIVVAIDSLTQAAAPVASFHLVFRPNGRLVGDGDLDVTNDGAQVVVTDADLPAQARVIRVTANGRICHLAVRTATPPLPSSITCP